MQPQPALVIRSRVARDEIAATIGRNLGRIVPHALGAGSGDIEAFTLPGGMTAVAVAVHGGPYDNLPETFTAFERWIAAQGHSPNGPPWEVYVTDPAEHPDSADWRTEIYWPVR